MKKNKESLDKLSKNSDEKDSGEIKKDLTQGKETEKKQTFSEKETLRRLLIIIGVIVGIFLVAFYLFYSLNNFEYKGVRFSKTNIGNLIFYRAVFPEFSEGEKIDYYMYIRDSPRELEEKVHFNGTIEFEDAVIHNGTIDLKENFVIEFVGDFSCRGDGAVAIGNLMRIRAFDVKIYNSENETCEPENDYKLIKVRRANETSIEQTGENCYDFNVNNCEIIPVTERFLLEIFFEMQKILDSD